MVLFKKHILKISLLLILLLAVFLCFYTIWNYHGNSATTQSRIEPDNSLPSERNRSSDIQNQTPRGQFPEPNATQRMVPPNGRMWGGITNADNKYAPQLITYSVIFLSLSIATYYLFIRKKIKIHPGHERILIQFASVVLVFTSSPYSFSVPMQLLRIKTSRTITPVMKRLSTVAATRELLSPLLE